MKIDSAASNVPFAGPESTDVRESTPIAQTHESTLNQAIDQAVHLFDHVISAMKGPGPASGWNDIQKTKDGLGDKAKDLQSEDKLGNFEIQELMSNSSKSEATISKIVENEADTANNLIQNMK